ncbi:MAG: pimeloyl-ACP methyl ester esterase BioH [Gammaproteobacteria bacterium]|jgi:pimeloyl-[acyl-carrier protein] methyl ester esterase|nr:pimeloyl-ACP methyl ester esterase BioH [Gammaproteobacteria bacterium]MBT4608029.1 pimeloyl-ACP methyl ester esterase BioH [Thiotrichales bacterium]MBT3471947.1 pimeloyl-ACP methyl ester esterase BioH [Gammaproteobacteria bacterium]MBT3966380.1 pimeloyl-ACP methyl ester esterase BioH [Gammaproteobacteria bacterium]MBT4080389.1 pimeloyl-ACP methyl ester esterase BioH [Gammaproteobacteria bacterium]
MRQNLVLIHGWGFNGSVWNSLLPQLEQTFEVTVVDLAGYRERPLLESMTLSAMVEDVAAQVPQRAIWLGWSLGGQVALQAAQEMPERISKLILVGATPRFVQGGGWRSAIKQKVLGDFAAALIRSRETTIGRFLTLQMLGVQGAKALLKELKHSLAEAPQAGTLEAGLEILQQSDFRPQLQQIQQPTRWIMGARDQLVPVEAGEAAATAMPHAAAVVIEGAGHAPFLSHPARFIEEVTRFAR